MAASRIEWTEQTWNPVTGCTEISAGCRHVRARSAMAVTTSKNPAGLRLARRFDAAPERVFAAWLDPGAARKWLFATPLYVDLVLQQRQDPRVDRREGAGKLCPP